MNRNGALILAIAVAAIAALAAVGIGYAISFSGSMTSTDNTNEVTLYGIDIYQGDSYTNATRLSQSLYLTDPQFMFDDTGVHKTVTPTNQLTVLSGYKLHTDNDYLLGAHIRMWVYLDNPLRWIFVDHIELSIVTDTNNIETFTCGITEDGGTINSGVHTDLIALPVHKTEHLFEVAIYYKDCVEVDYLDELDLSMTGARIVFAYDDVDPISPGGDDV